MAKRQAETVPEPGEPDPEDIASPIDGNYEAQFTTFREALQQAEEARVEALTRAGELQDLFDLQYTRMGEATEAWRAEAPEERELIQPDLGDLLTWLLARSTGLSPELRQAIEDVRVHGCNQYHGHLSCPVIGKLVEVAG